MKVQEVVGAEGEEDEEEIQPELLKVAKAVETVKIKM